MSVDVLREAAARMESDAQGSGDRSEFLQAVSEWLKSEVEQWVETFSRVQLPPEGERLPPALYNGDPFGAAVVADRYARHALAVAYAYLD